MPVIVGLIKPNYYISSEYVTTQLANMVDVGQNVTFDPAENVGQRFYNFWLDTYVEKKITQNSINT